MPRHTITPKQKLDHLATHEVTIAHNESGAYLRGQGVYSSQIAERRKLRYAGVLASKKPGERVGWLIPEQAETARLRRQLELSERQLSTTEVALEMLSKNARARGNAFNELTGSNAEHEAMMSTKGIAGGEKARFECLLARNCWLLYKERHLAGPKFTEIVASGELSAPVAVAAGTNALETFLWGPL